MSNTSAEADLSLYSRAAQSDEVAGRLSASLTAMVDELAADTAFIIIQDPRDRMLILDARHRDHRIGREVDRKSQFLGKKLVESAWEMGDSLLSLTPFAELVGRRRTFALVSETLNSGTELRSAMAAPIRAGNRSCGAFLFHEKLRDEPFGLGDLDLAEKVAHECAKVIADAAKVLRGSPPMGLVPRGLVGSSQRFQAFLARLEKFARWDSPVLITGESGTGKEETARLLHERSRRRNGPFVAVNMSAFAPELALDQLFGHARGAFTGAAKDKAGEFERANGGTIFLDEIGDCRPDLQAALLRVLQEKCVQRLGEDTPRPLDVRVISATNKDLDRLMAEGRFRDDLFFRLAVFRLETVPLKDHIEDLPAIIENLVARIVVEEGIPVGRFSPDALRKLADYDWPGNVRELQGVLKSAIALGGETIMDYDIEIVKKKELAPAPLDKVVLEGIDCYRALVEARGDHEQAAALLGIARSTLFKRIEKAQITGFDTKKTAYQKILSLKDLWPSPTQSETGGPS
jgi:DNA-binding NtrC family response regulator